MRRLELHETRAHALGTARDVRDLGDAILMYDPHDRDPFWNRLTAVRFPLDRNRFDRRLDEVVVLFGGLDRRPHVWQSAGFNEPADLAARLGAHGFVDLGAGLVMVHLHPGPLEAARSVPLAAGISVERLARPRDAFARATASAELALVLAEAFELDPGRRNGLLAETSHALGTDELTAYLARVEGEPAAAAKRTAFDGASYLSSIGTRPRYRGRGLAALVTAAATHDAIVDGDALVYLGVWGQNRTARRLYERLGFVVLGHGAGDFILP